MPILKSPLNNEQWELYTAFNAELQSGEWFTILPGMPLRYWLDKNEHLPIAQEGDRVAWALRNQIRLSSILISVVKKEGNDICLGVAITDNGDAQAAYYLQNAGVKVVPWEQAQQYVAKPRNLILDAEKAIRQPGHRARRSFHVEEFNLRRELMTALNMWWGRHAGNKVVMNPGTRGSIDRYMQSRCSQLAVLWEVALSRFIEREAHESHTDLNREAMMINYSSVDLLVCATQADGIPILAVEYDGVQHRTEQNKIANDAAKDSLFAKAGLPILRISSNEGRAAASEWHGKHLPVSPRLLPMLEIARYIVDENLKALARSEVQAEMGQRLFTRWESLARTLYEKPFLWLSDQERSTVIEQSIDSGADDWETEAEWALNDAEDRRYWSLDGQLHWSGVSRELIEDFCIVEKGGGRVAKGRLRVPGSATRRSIETVVVKLRIPNMAQDKITELEDMQLYSEFAADAKELLSAAFGCP